MKENGGISRCGVSGICAGVYKNERSREVVVVFLNDICYGVLVKFGC